MADVDDPWQHVPPLEDAAPHPARPHDRAVTTLLVISLVLLALTPIIVVALVLFGDALLPS